MQKFGKYISFAVIIMYFILGILLLINPQVIIFNHQFYIGDIQPELRIIIGIILVLYGCYRLARMLTKKNDPTPSQDESN
jgi:phosphatidylserine synthase